MDDTTPTLEGLIADLGGPATPVPEATDPPPNPDPKPTATEPGATPPADPAPAAPAAPVVDPQTAKDQQAFIHMRQQNKQLNDTLKGIAGVLGLTDTETADSEKLLTALQQKITTDQAEKQKVPVELLQRLQTLEQRDQEYTTLQRKNELAVGMQRLHDTFKLTEDQLNGFAAELVAKGINPLVQSVDFMKEYRNLHFDEILKAETAKAVLAEQERATKAANQSTTPNPKQGTPAEPAGKITSVRQLNDWFNQQTKS